MPKSSNLCPSTPRNWTWERSGSFRLASPPASSAGCASVETALRSTRAAAATPAPVNLYFRTMQRHKNRALASQVLINHPPYHDRIPGELCLRVTAFGTPFVLDAAGPDHRTAACLSAPGEHGAGFREKLPLQDGKQNPDCRAPIFPGRRNPGTPPCLLRARLYK